MMQTTFRRLATTPSALVPLIVLLVIGAGAGLGWLASPLLLISLLAFVAGLVLVRQGESHLIALVLVAFLIPIEFSVSAEVSINAVVLVIPVLAVFWFLHNILTGHFRLHKSRTFPPLVAFLMVVSLAWLLGNVNWEPTFAPPPNLLLIQLGQWAIYAFSMAAFILAAHQSPDSLRRLTYLFLILGAVALVSRYGGLVGQLTSRVVGLQAAENGSFYVWVTALAGGQALFNRQISRPRKGALLALAICVPALGIAQSLEWASSWLPPLIVIGVLLMLRYPLPRFAFFAGALSLLISASGFVAQIWQAERYYSVGGRLLLWESILQLAWREPILGLGLTSYHLYHRYIPLLTDRGRWFNPNVNSHNVFIDLFAQVGLVGLILFLWAMLEIFRLGWRLRNRSSADFYGGYVHGALAGLIGILFASTIVEWILPFVYNTGFPAFRFSVFNWVFLGGLVALDRMYAERAGQPAATADPARPAGRALAAPSAGPGS